VGCLPLLLLFPLGFGAGYLIGGDIGGLWGAGIGLLLGVLAMAWLIKALRRRR
jgi:tetrahydromethanopterin S-methyltransferase subunit G